MSICFYLSTFQYFVKYRHECGNPLDSGTEKFCPKCGQNLTQQKSSDDRKNKYT